MANFIKIKETFCGWTDVRTDGHLRPALLGRLWRRVDPKTTFITSPPDNVGETYMFSDCPSVRLFVWTDSLLLPRSDERLEQSWWNLHEYSTAPAGDLVRFYRSKVKSQGHSRPSKRRQHPRRRLGFELHRVVYLYNVYACLTFLGRIACMQCTDAASCCRCRTKRGLCVEYTSELCKNGWNDDHQLVWLMWVQGTTCYMGSRYPTGRDRRDADFCRITLDTCYYTNVFHLTSGQKNFDKRPHHGGFSYFFTGDDVTWHRPACSIAVGCSSHAVMPLNNPVYCIHHSRDSQCFSNDRKPTKIASARGRSRPPSNTWFLGPIWVRAQTASRSVQLFSHSVNSKWDRCTSTNIMVYS